MMKNITVLLLLWCSAAFAQDKIDTDRPTETQSAKTVGRGVFQLETGFRKDGRGGDYDRRLPDAEWRYGVLDRVELRLYTVAETDRVYSKQKFADGLRPLELGLKTTVLQTKDTSFAASLYGHWGIDAWSAEEHRTGKNFYRLRLLFHNQISKAITVQYNLGRDWHNDREGHFWLYALAPHFDLGEKWQVFGETYGYFNHGEEPEHYADAGGAYYISKNVEVDAAVGKGLSGEGSEYFFTVGVSFRVK